MPVSKVDGIIIEVKRKSDEAWVKKKDLKTQEDFDKAYDRILRDLDAESATLKSETDKHLIFIPRT